MTDDVLPVTGTLTSGGSTNDTDLTVAVSLSGTGAVAGDTVQLYNGTGTGSQLGTSYTLTATDIANGAVNLQTGTLTNGTTYTITARVTDQAGNQSNASSSFTVTEDTTAPNAGTLALTGFTDTGSSASDFVTQDNSFTLSLSGQEGGSTVVYQVSTDNGVTWTTTSTAQSGLADGTYKYRASVTDAAGNSSTGNVITVTVDNTAPGAPSITSVTDNVPPITGTVSDNGSTDDSTLTITGAAETGSTVTIYDTDGTTVVGTGVAAGGTYSITTSVLSQGNHTLTAKATDAAGNQSAASTAFHVSIDTTAPSAAVAITSVSGSSSPGSTAIIVSGTSGILAAGDKVQISTDGVTWTDVSRTSLTRWTFTDSTLRSADFTYLTRVVDSVGNVGSTASQPVKVVYNGATAAVSGAAPVVAAFTGTGGNLQIAAGGLSATLNAISVAAGAVEISGSGNVATSTGDAIDLYATGANVSGPANLTVDPTGQITGAATGISVTQNATGSITITTSGPVTGLAGRGIFAQQTATGSGSILINGSGPVTGTGTAFSGITAFNLDSANNGNITISQSGNVTGGHDGIYARTYGNGNIAVNTGTNALITGLTLYGIEAQSRGTGNIQVTTASGTEITSAGAGINAYNEATVLPKSGNVIVSSISVTANGTIDSGTTLTGAGNRPAGILAGYRGGTTNTPNPGVFGNVGISNFATINAAGGDGIRGYNYGGGNVTISNAATIVARDVFGINGTSYGSGNVAVTTTSGSNITSGSHGILAINQANAVGAAAGSTVTVTAGGTINAGVHLTPGGASPAGISAGYYGPSGFPNTSINGTVLVDNYANITSRGQWGIIAFNVGYGNVTVISRTGTSVNGLQYGIGANSSVPGTASPSDIAVTVESGATVTASALSGIAAISANNTSGGSISISTGTGATFQSGGTGINANVGAASVAFGKQISVTTSTGTINSGFNFFSGGGTPSGISAGYANGPGNFNANVHGNVVVDNSATITAASGPGINLYNSGDGSLSATLRSSSSVTALQGGGVTAFSIAGGNITIDNQGTINAAAVGISANNGSGNSANGLISITNSGTVNAPGVPFIPVVTVGNGNSSQTATVSNSAGKSIASTLFARTTNNFAFSFYAGNGSVTNNGSITGNLTFSGSGSFTNAAGAFWNLNGSNFFGGGASTINNAGFMNISGLATLSAMNAIALANTGNIFVLPNSSAQIFGDVTGVGSINLGDRSALELGLAVAATQTINFAGRGLLTFDGPASVGANLPLNFTSGTNGNVGSIITLQGGGITAANVSGSTLTVTGVQNYAFQVSGSGLSGNIFNVLSPDRIILIPAIGAGTTIVSNNNTPTTNNSPAAPVNFYSVYVLDNNHIAGTTGSGYNLNTADSVAANTYALVVNSNSNISVTGPANNFGLRVGTSGASGAIVSAASSISAGDFGINVNIAAGSGNADIVDYGNVTGGQSAIAANTLNGNIRIFAGPGANLTGTTSFGIVGSANGSGGVNIATSGGTISGGITGITAVARQATPSSASVVVYNSSNVTGGTNGATANVAGSGASGIRAGILANNGTNFDPPNTAITGDVTIESRGNITALYGSGLHAYNYGAGNTSVTFLPGQYAINAVNAGVTTPGNGLVQYGIFAFTYGKGSSLVNAGWGTTITSGSTGINAGNQATAIASGSGSTVSVYSQGFISSGANLNNSGSAPSAIQAGYNPAGNGQFSSAVYGDVIVNVASDGNPFGNPNPTLLAAAGPGILAYNYGVGNISVSVGFGVSIQALTAASASGGGNAPYGIAATNRGPGNISVITSGGSFINSGSNGINAVNDANPTAGSDLANLFAANATAGNPAVIAVTAAGSINSGNLLTNAGNTPSGIAAGFFGASGHANQYVSGNVFINNAALITAAGYGLQGYNFGYGNITINEASGANITAGSHGIYAHADGGFTDPVAPGVLTRDIAVTVNANTTIIAGTASSTAYGIFALSTNAGNMSVVTSTGDTIDSHQGGAGINVVNEATSIAPSFNSSLLVSNAATIHSGVGLTGFGNQPAGILAGYIGQATSPGPTNPANYNVHGEVSVYNSGNITADAGDGIRAYNYGVGDIYVNNFAGTIVASGGASPPNGSGIGILAQNFGPGSVHLTTSASTSITSGSSGIVAINKATTADPLNPTVVVPATSEVDVYASGTIHSGTTPTGSGDPAAGILAGYNPNNLNTPNNAVHGSVFVDSHATILAAAGTDGIRGVNYGDGDITIVVESDSDVTGGRFGVAALGYNGGNVSVTIRGSVVGQTAALDADTTGTGTVTIDNAGYLGGLVIGDDATFTIEAGADWQFSGANIFTGTTSTLANAGTIETRGVSSIGGLTSFTNSGLIAVDSGSLTIGAPVTGGGAALIYDASLVLTGAADMNVRFADINPATGGMLVLQDPVHFTGTVTGFTFGDTIDLTGIAPASVSVTNNSGFLQVNFAGGAIQLLGNYDPSGFSIITDGGTGTLVSWSHGSPSIDTTQFTLVNNPDNSTTVLGLHVNDADAAATLTMTAVTAGAASGTTITPSASSGSLATINGALSGVTYDPGATPPATEKITLSVVDNWGVSSTVNFIFTPGNSGGGGVTLEGTSGNDVIFSTGGPDTLTGGTGRDQFVFGPDFSSSVQDTITDFVEGIDRIDLREFSGISSANIQNLIQAAQTAQASGLTGNDTLLTLDSANHITVLLKNVQASSLQAGDFIVHS
ncbi:MAG TPA: Ig-like domain-containing protein [Bradyrhizobium sp.]|nr:Ig-like domain-containing protein [Bradyrhizobium sp.]